MTNWYTTGRFYAFLDYSRLHGSALEESSLTPLLLSTYSAGQKMKGQGSFQGLLSVGRGLEDLGDRENFAGRGGRVKSSVLFALLSKTYTITHSR